MKTRHTLDAYYTNYHNGDHQYVIRDEIAITEELAYIFLRRFNK